MDTPIDPMLGQNETQPAGDPRTKGLPEDVSAVIDREMPATIKGLDDYKALPAGTRYIDPTGQRRTKAYEVTDRETYDAVPEGATYLDPEGQQRKKPAYESINFTAQTLFNMGVNDKERRRALERSYPGKVKQDEITGELYVDDEGTLRKPGRGASGVGGFVAAAAAPTAGAVLGAIGGAAGGAVTGLPAGGVGAIPGGVAGAAAGGAGGSILGSMFNDTIMALAGVQDRSMGERAADYAVSGATGMAGAGVGRGLGVVLPQAKAAIKGGIAGLPAAATHILGVDPEGLKMARKLSEEGVLVPPSGWAKEAPHIQNVVEVFDKAFHTQDPLGQSAKAYYEKSGKKILEGAGAPIHDLGELLDPQAAVSPQLAGRAMMLKAQGEALLADTRLRAAVDEAKGLARSGQAEAVGAQEMTVVRLQKAAQEQRQAAEGLVYASLDDIQKNIDVAMDVTKARGNSGDLWTMVGEKLRETRKAIGERASKMYGQAHELSEGIMPASEGLGDRARLFLDQVPEPFRAGYPSLIQKVAKLAEGESPTFAQLHEMRTQFRSQINWSDLTPDFREGAMKHFQTKINEILLDAETVPALRPAVEMLKQADEFYRGAMKPLTDKNVQAVLNGLESGMPGDPQLLFKTVVKEGRPELAKQVEKLVGPNLWNAIKAADVQDMFEMAKSLEPGKIDGRAFVRQVLDRHRHGMLDAIHGKEVSDKLLEAARSVEMLEGRMPVVVKADDTLTTTIARARGAAEEAKKAAAKDPLKLLRDEMRGIERDYQRTVRQLADERKADPLKFLYDPTLGAMQAADKVLGNEDLILATAARFGEKSPEFEMLRQVYLHRILQGSMNVGDKLEKITPEVQKLMFPGATLEQMQTLAKEMNFLLDTKAARMGTGISMAAVSKVEQPWGTLGSRKSFAGQVLKGIAGSIPGSDMMARYVLGTYYGLIRDLVTSPVTLRWLEKGLKGSDAAKAEARALLAELIAQSGQVGAGIGAGAGQLTYQGAGP